VEGRFGIVLSRLDGSTLQVGASALSLSVGAPI